MFSTLAKKTAARLPHEWQQALKRRHFQRHIARDTFRTDEPEWELAARWLAPGDWAIDVGANIGHYSKRFSDLVGAGGRVIAFEPVPATFELLAANAARFAWTNVTLLNLAASDATGVVGMDERQLPAAPPHAHEAPADLRHEPELERRTADPPAVPSVHEPGLERHRHGRAAYHVAPARASR